MVREFFIRLHTMCLELVMLSSMLYTFGRKFQAVLENHSFMIVVKLRLHWWGVAIALGPSTF